MVYSYTYYSELSDNEPHEYYVRLHSAAGRGRTHSGPSSACVPPAPASPGHSAESAWRTRRPPASMGTPSQPRAPAPPPHASQSHDEPRAPRPALRAPACTNRRGMTFLCTPPRAHSSACAGSTTCRADPVHPPPCTTYELPGNDLAPASRCRTETTPRLGYITVILSAAVRAPAIPR